MQEKGLCFDPGDAAVWYMGGASRAGYDYITYGMDRHWQIVGANPSNSS